MFNNHHHLSTTGDSPGALSDLSDDEEIQIELTEHNVDLTVDVDSEIEDSLEGGFLSEDSEEGAENAPYPGLNTSADSIAEEYAARIEQARSAWSEQERADMKHALREGGMIEWLKEYVINRRERVEKLLYAFEVLLSKRRRLLDDLALLPVLKAALLRELRKREKLPQYNTVDDAVVLLRRAKKIIVLTGAGISVSCGIPDFRSRDGLYAQLHNNGEYLLDDPQQMFDISFFKENPSVFYSFANKIYPSNFTPSPCHRFIKAIEDKDKLLRNYTQNIDTLETQAGIRKVLQCHGSFATATCINCRIKVPGTDIKDDILSQRIPLCKVCNIAQPAPAKPRRPKKKKKRTDGWESDEPEEPIVPLPQGIMKPDITFFGEKLTDDFDEKLFEDRESVDLLLVIGTSLKVAPVSEILTHLPHSIPQIVINKTPIRHINPDILLLGDADGIVQYLARRLDWDISLQNSSLSAPRNVRKRSSDSFIELGKPRRIGNSHIWLFEGAEGGKFVQDLEAAYQSLPQPQLPRSRSWTPSSNSTTSDRTSKRPKGP